MRFSIKFILALEIFIFVFVFASQPLFSKNIEKQLSNNDQAAMYYGLQKWDSAAFYFKLWESEELQKKNYSSYISAITGCGLCNYYQNDIKKASTCLTDAINASKKYFPNKNYHYGIYRLQAQIQYYNHDFQNAAISYEKAISGDQIKEAIGSTEMLLNILILQSYCYNTLNDWEHALLSLKHAEKLLPTKQTEMHFYTYSYYGLCYFKAGEYDKSTLYYNKAIEYAKNLKMPPDKINSLLCSIGFNFYAKGEYLTAVDYGLEGLKIVPERAASYAITARSIAYFYEKTNDDIKALHYYKIAFDFWNHNKSYNEFEKIQTFLNYGNFSLKTNRVKEGLKILNQGLKICKNTYGGKHYLTSKILLALGNHYSQINSFEKALNYYQEALISNTPKFNQNDIYSNPENLKVTSVISQIVILKQKAVTLNKLFNQTDEFKCLIASANTYDCMVQHISKLKDQIFATEDKLTLVKNTNEAINDALVINTMLYSKTCNQEWFEKAFQLAEMGKASVLMSEIKNNNAKQFGNIPTSFKKRESQLERDILAYEKMLFDENIKKNKNNDLLHSYESKIFDLKRVQDTIIKYYEHNFPEYYRLKYKNVSSGTYQIQKSLEPDQTMLEYCVTDTMIFIFAINKVNKALIALKKCPEFEKSISIYQNEFSRKSALESGVADFDAFSGASYILFKNLILPVQKLISGKRLIIISDEALENIPFEVFITSPANKHDNFRLLSYLIKKHSMSYQYMGSLICYDVHEKNQSENSIAAFAPNYEEQGARSNNLIDRDFNLGNLNWTGKEVAKICKIFGGDSYTGEEATKTSFIKTIKTHNIFHFAMHSIVDIKHPMYSGLMFSKSTDSSDNFLSAFELYGMKIHATMAVLSACNTGNGQLIKGEGIMSLARAFYFAGVKSLIMTLWSVEDRNSAALMQQFYSFLAGGNPKDIALQKAKLAFLQSADELQSHPYFWAGYVNIGNTDSLLLQKKNTTIYILISVLFLLFVLSFIFILRQKLFKFFKNFFRF